MTEYARLSLSVDSRDAKKAGDDLDRLTRKGASAERGLKTATGRMRRSFDVVRRSVFSVQSALVTLGAGLALRKVMGEFAQFEKLLITVGKTADLEGRELELLGERIQLIGRRVPVSTARLLELAGAAGQLGVKGVDNISKFAETLGKLETATDVAGEEGARSLARLLNITGESISDIDRLGSAITALGNNFATTEQEIVSMSTFLGASTQQFDLSAAEVVGLSAAMRSLGQRAETAGSSIGAALAEIDTAIASGNENLSLLINLTGQSREELERAFGESAVSVLVDFTEALDGLPTARQTEILDSFNLAGRETRRVIGALSSDTDMIRRALKSANEEWEINEALNIEAAKSAKSFSAQMTFLGNALNEAAVDIGRELSPVILDITRRFRDFIQEASDSGQLEDFFGNVAEAADELLGKLEAISRILLAIAGASAGAKAGSAMGALGGARGRLIGGAVGGLTGGAAGFFSPEIFQQLVGGESGDQSVVLGRGTINRGGTSGGTATGGAGGNDRNGGSGGGTGVVGGVDSEIAARRIMAMEREVALFGELTNLEQARISIANNFYGKISEGQEEKILGLSRELDRREALEAAQESEIEKQKELAEITQQRKDAKEDLIRSFETEEELARRIYGEQKQLINELIADDKLRADLKLRNEQQLFESLKAINERNAEEMSEFARRASQNIQDELGKTVRDSLSGDFDGILSSWGNMLAEMGSQAIAARLAESLGIDDLLSGKSGSGGGGIMKKGSSALSSLFGGGDDGESAAVGIAKEAGESAEVIAMQSAAALLTASASSLTGAGAALTTSAATLSPAGTILSTAGTTLSAAGGGLTGAAGALTASTGALTGSAAALTAAASALTGSSLASFDGGGSTGTGPRVGGVDGRGGFPALLHPNETVVDHTKGQNGGGGNVYNLYVTSNGGKSERENKQAGGAFGRSALQQLKSAERYA